MGVVLLSVVADTIEHEDYLPRVQPYVQGCPRPVVLTAINQAISEFCQKTLIWRETLPTFDLTVDDDIYALSLPADMAMVMPVYVSINGSTIHPMTEEELDHMDYGWRTSDTGTPSKYFCPEPGTIQFNRKPEETLVDAVKVRAALKPSTTALTSGATIYANWYETIRRGALHYLMEMPKKEWSDPAQAMVNGRYFNSQIQSALAQANRGNTRKPTYARLNSIGYHRRR